MSHNNYNLKLITHFSVFAQMTQVSILKLYKNKIYTYSQ